jgi:hypothetical protein
MRGDPVVGWAAVQELSVHPSHRGVQRDWMAGAPVDFVGAASAVARPAGVVPSIRCKEGEYSLVFVHGSRTARFARNIHCQLPSSL